MQKAIVTGASGFLGWHFCHYENLPFIPHGLGRNRPGSWAFPWYTLDLTRTDQLYNLLKKAKPDLIWHFAALSKPNDCQENPDRSFAVNVEATRRLGMYCLENNIPLIFTSTDLVFDGEEGRYSEEDTPRPISTYGKHKLQAERYLLEMGGPFVICRMPLMFGPPSPGGESFLQPLMRSLAAGESLRLFADEIRSPSSVGEAIDGLLKARKTGPGLYHLGGPEILSRYRFGEYLVACTGDSPEKLSKCYRKDFPMPAPRPRDVSMISLRLKRDMQPLPHQIRQVVDEVRNGTKGIQQDRV